MEAVDDQNPLQLLDQALVAATSESDEERNPATQFILETKKNDVKQFTAMLIIHLSDDKNQVRSRALAAILIYNILHQRTNDSQRKFNSEWVSRVDFDVKEKLRVAATIGLFSDSNSFSIQCANLLGLFYSIEILYGNFKKELSELFNIAVSSENIAERVSALFMFKRFQKSCYEYNPNCYAASSLRDITLSLFDALIEGMKCDNPEIAHASIDTLMNPIKFYERPINFKKQRGEMLEIVVEYIRSEDDSFAIDGYSLARKLIEYYYELVKSTLPTIIEIVEEALNNGSDNRKIASCLLLQTIGEVESQDNENDEQSGSDQSDFTPSQKYSSPIIKALFIPLVMIICNCPIDDTEAKVSFDKTPQNAAFWCLSYLAKAADSDALELILGFVEENGTNEDWRFRFCSILLLNAATQLPSFDDQTNSNYMTAFNFFIQMISDPIARIVEVSFWGLGQIIRENPKLVLDQERFEMICNQIPTVLLSSPNLESRCFWLLHIIFVAFKGSDEETSQVLGDNFDQFADMLLSAAESADADTVCSAYAAINDLVLYAPNGIVVEYNRLFEKITAILLRIIAESDGKLTSVLELNRTKGICMVLETITMFVGDRITEIADKIMNMLSQLLQTSNGVLIPEVLPCIGAVARAIKNQFAPYADDLIPLLNSLLQSQEYIQPASFLIGDLYSSLDSLPKEVTNNFVHSLLDALNLDVSNDIRNEILNVLGTQIAQNIGTDCIPWLDIFLKRLESESKEAVEKKESIDIEFAEKIHLTILYCFQTLVPILQEVQNGYKKVVFFFYIFDHIAKTSFKNQDVLKQAVILIGEIAESFGRKLNYVLNRPTVISLLELAKKSDDDELAQMSSDLLDVVRNC